MDKKYRLLVADDEYWIREKFKTILDWGLYDIEFMKPAEDGEETLKIIEEEKPDILITDINMPFVNGVDIIRHVKEQNLDTVIFVISGYDDFDYVKESLKAGAINYLLKPVDKVDLVAALSEALEIIADREKEKENTLKLSSLVQDREMSLLVEREPKNFIPQFIVENDKTQAGYSMMLIKLHDMSGLHSKLSHDMNGVSHYVKSIIREIAGDERLLCFNYIFRANEYIIVDSRELSHLKKLAEDIAKKLSGESGGPVTISISGHSYEMEALHNAYSQCVAALMQRPFNRENAIVEAADKKEEAYILNPVSAADETEIKNYIKNGNVKGLRSYVYDTVGLKGASENSWQYLRVRQCVNRILNLFLECSLQCLGDEMKISAVELEQLTDEAERCAERLDKEGLFKILDEYTETICPENDKPQGGAREIIREAVGYVDDNYFEDLSLSQLSKKYGIEGSYFSKMFKNETGKNLMVYIAEMRMNRAKELILSGNTNLTEVSFIVGYDDYTYFNRVFKKYIGMSPSEYKNSLITN